MIKRLLCTALTCLLALALIPVAALAVEPDAGVLPQEVTQPEDDLATTEAPDGYPVLEENPDEGTAPEERPDNDPDTEDDLATTEAPDGGAIPDND
ncbi:MAG: hypothetical protein LBI64_06455, partial [Coriobacteriales bacterium]|nr:hypothetical protein [Coriobacteriales bacterium]